MNQKETKHNIIYKEKSKFHSPNFIQFEEDIFVCSFCKERTIIYDVPTGQYVCTECGNVNRDRCIDEGKDWRSYDFEDEGKRARCGPTSNIYFLDKGLSTSIPINNVDGDGNRLPASTIFKMNRIRKTDCQNKSHNTQTQNYEQIVCLLRHYAIPELFNLTKHQQERILTLYRKLLKSEFMKGFSIKYMLLVLIYRVCIEDHSAKTLYEMTSKGKITQRQFNMYLKKISGFFQFEPISIHPTDYLKSLFSILKIDSGEMYKLTKQICDIYVYYSNPRYITGIDPAGILGGALYFTSKLMKYNLTQIEIGTAVHCTEVTIRNRYWTILKALYQLYTYKAPKFIELTTPILTNYECEMLDIFIAICGEWNRLNKLKKNKK